MTIYYQQGAPSKWLSAALNKLRPKHFGRGWRKFRKHRGENQAWHEGKGVQG